MIQSIKYIKEDLTDRMKGVKLLNRDYQPYKNSDIYLARFNPFDLLPCQTYVLEKQLNVLTEINNYCNYNLKANICELDGYLEIHTDKGITIMTPPVIEKEIESVWMLSESPKRLICDGMHRVYWAIENQIKSINCLYIESPSMPYYAYPTVGGWDGVELITKPFIPLDFVKKYYRQDDYKALYRDFNTVFDHQVGKPRGRGQQ